MDYPAEESLDRLTNGLWFMVEVDLMISTEFHLIFDTKDAIRTALESFGILLSEFAISCLWNPPQSDWADFESFPSDVSDIFAIYGVVLEKDNERAFYTGLSTLDDSTQLQGFIRRG